MATLLAGQQPDGGFGPDPYRKWGGAFWRLVSLVDLAVPAETPGVRELFDHVLDSTGGSGCASPRSSPG